MENNKFSWNEVVAYSIVALHNYINSGNYSSDNKIKLKDIKLFIEPLKQLYKDKNIDIVEYANKLLANEK